MVLMREGTQMKHKLNRRLAKLACAKTKRPKSLTTMRCADLKNSFKKPEKTNKQPFFKGGLFSHLLISSGRSDSHVCGLFIWMFKSPNTEFTWSNSKWYSVVCTAPTCMTDNMLLIRWSVVSCGISWGLRCNLVVNYWV